jgi:hypothetical protein
VFGLFSHLRNRFLHSQVSRGIASTFGVFMTVAAVALVLLASPMADPANAQDRSEPAVELAAGWIGFADDGVVSETLIGGAARVYVLRRIGVGPEVLYLRGERHSHLVVTGNVTWDVFAPMNGRQRPVVPFFVVGGGLFQTRETFPSGDFTSSEGAFTAGGGVRALAGDRLMIGLDARVGWELHVRVNGTIGVRLGR